LKKNIPFTYFLFLLCVSGLFLYACNSTYTSKKKGYYKIDFPERKYIGFQKEGFPYSFEYPVYAQVIKDSTESTDPYAIDLDFPQFNGRIFISYKQIGGMSKYKVQQADGSYLDSMGINTYDKLRDDAFKLTYKNEPVASSMKDSLMYTPQGITGVYFKVGGNAATAIQFFLSDTSKHFFRGSLYFNVTPNVDSIKPVLNFLQQDIDHLINTFKWVDTRGQGPNSGG
jgi:gliding motility-associated lipoprotein GldD